VEAPPATCTCTFRGWASPSNPRRAINDITG
jgi:hypothetical protein